MEKFNFTLENYHRPTVGLIVLQSDEALEEELRAWLPDHYRLLHSRIPSGAAVNEDSLLAMKSALPTAVSLLPTSANLSVVAYGCTSASTLIGESVVAKIVHEHLPGVTVTNPISALKARLKHLDINRIALLTPYLPEVSQAMADHLTASGLSINAFGSFHEEQEERVCRIARASIIEAMRTLGAHDTCDAVFASCTNLRTLEILDDVSTAIGKPVISSNSALSWHIQHLAETQ